MMRAFLAGLWLLVAPLAAMAETASLVADRVFLQGDTVLIAEGNVEIFQGDARLKAARVTYDRSADRLTIDGPIQLDDGGSGVLLADGAELSADLRQGVIRGARLVLDRQLQLAAAELQRADDRYTRLSRVTASSCRVCASNPVPLWEIRAKRVIRDEEELQLYFDDAQFRLAGVPIFYLPYLRMPDPSLDRATGFLTPRLVTRTRIGTGLQLPYFLAIGDHADLTITPWITGTSQTLGLEGRQELRNGRVSFEGALSSDDLTDGGPRGYLFLDARFDLPRDYTLSFNAETVSDRAYLYDYGISGQDRLSSTLRLSRTRDEKLVDASLTSYRTLRASEIATADELPNEVAQLDFRRRLADDPLWGLVWGEIDAVSLYRPSSDPTLGRDTARLGARLNWSNQTVLGNGIVLEGAATTGIAQYAVHQDPNFDSAPLRTDFGLGLTLRWPLERQGADGARHLLEPIFQLAWAGDGGDAVPNEDSTTVEFDEGNLFSLSRFPGEDRVEEGLRLNSGLTWTRYDPDGWSLDATLGRVIRFDNASGFGADTGLSGRSSDWLLSMGYSLGSRLEVRSRSLVDDNLDISRSETLFSWTMDTARLRGAYLWRAAEPSEGLLNDLNELYLDGDFDLDRNWTASADWRFDADTSNTTRAGLGLSYENECIDVGLSVSRRFTESSSVRPVTELDFRVELNGFGGRDGRGKAQACRG